MKKTYFAPVVELKSLNTEIILATSTIGVDPETINGTSSDHIEAGARGNGSNTQDKLDLI